MKLKKLELFGFKSFPDKTAVEFHDGITGVVGPNGCGKSNVVDAFKWILGEQSAKSLRGTEMLDVIFNGTRERKALGYAEASLVFIGVRDTLNCDRDEVKITRRLWRSGESEYMIDGKNCRLRDIRELFMDTGIGKEAYSVIEQGKIDKLLNSNAKERRSVFEEAAGITRYKAKRKQAERTLERVDNRLEVLRVKIESLETQVRSLRIQAGRARKYREYVDGIESLQTEEALHNYHKMTGELGSLKEMIKGVSGQKQEIEVEYEKLEAAVAENEKVFLDISDKLRSTEASIQEQESVLRVSAERRRAARDRIAEIDREIERLTELVAELNVSRRELEADLAVAERDLEGHGGRIAQCRSELESARKQYAEVAGELSRTMDALEEKKLAHLSLLDSRSMAQNRLNDLNVEKRGLTVRKERCDQRHGELSAKLELASRQRREMDERISTLEHETTELASEMNLLGEVLSEGDGVIDYLKKKIATGRREEERVSTRLDVLRELMDKGESFERGARTIIDHVSKSPDSFPGFTGVLADLIDVDSEHAAAVEGALGIWAGALVVENDSTASNIVSHLREKEGGRAPFIVLSRVPEVPQPVPCVSGVEGQLSSFVRTEQKVKAAIDWLLADDYLVRESADPLNLLDSRSNGARFVTSTGEIYGPKALAHAGNGAASAGPLVAKAEAAELMQKLKMLQAAIAYDEAGLERARISVTETRTEFSRREARSAEVRQEMAAISIRKDSLLGSLSEMETESDIIRREVLAIDDELTFLYQNETSVVDEINIFREKEAELAEATAKIRESVNDLETEKERKMAIVSEREVELAQLTEKERSLAARRDHVRRMLEEKAQHIEGAIHDGETMRDRRGAYEESIVNEEKNIQEAVIKRQELEAGAAELSARKSEIRGKIDEDRHMSRGRTAELKEIEERLSDLRMRETGFIVKRDELIIRFREEHDIELAAHYENYSDREQDWEEVHGRIVNLKQKLQRLGNVNLEAIDQLAEHEAELEREQKQEADLRAAREKLIETIKRVNSTSTKLFIETFESVRVHFRELFRKLFGRTAEADIYLADESDPLECGIEIKARPPGKQLRHISLLSGGEKVMTTVALLFAIFKSKPSPFCILDEVDAALDDTNIRRFTEMLGGFLDRSQFLIITHNKLTMMVCDILYGVTMQEPGVSKKISVDLETRVA
ncbi:MAG: chromosome segregation protein SMC [Planctomycetota bacterium]|jgi:chromosome segregation protein